MKLKDIEKEGRPRERFTRFGANVLSDAELLALVLKTGTKGVNAVELSQQILSLHSHLPSAPLSELQTIRGVGPAKAIQIAALFAFASRHSSVATRGKPLRSARDVYDYALPLFFNADREMFVVLHLDTKNRVVREEVASMGTLNSSLIHPREVFKTAVKESAHSVIFLHNHPSGDPTPSSEDRDVTTRLREAGEMLEIPVLDHVIVGNGTYYSFKEEGS